jgi:hypothetical protein
MTTAGRSPCRIPTCPFRLEQPDARLGRQRRGGLERLDRVCLSLDGPGV